MRRVMACLLAAGGALAIGQGSASAQDVVGEEPPEDQEVVIADDAAEVGGGVDENGALAAGTLIELTPGADELCLLRVNGQRAYCKIDREVHTFTELPVMIRGLADNDVIVIRDTTVGGCTCTCTTSYPIADYNYGGSTVTVGGGAGADQVYGGYGTNLFYGHLDPYDGSGTPDDSFYDFLIGGRQQDRLYGALGDDLLIDRQGSAEVLMGEGGDRDCLNDLGSWGWLTLDCGVGSSDTSPNPTAPASCERDDTCTYTCPGLPFP